ncbi:MAG: nucleotidyltransferase family protein [Alistipes sp.]|nr:nucleotidyltransferase family protein [Alistipes sp.]
MDITNILRSIFDAEAEQINYASLGSEQWREIYTFSAEQGILAFVWDALQDAAKRDSSTLANMPRELKIRWALNVEQIEQKYARQRAVIEKLSVFLAQHNIKMMVVKGYGLSLCFPRADHRPCGISTCGSSPSTLRMAVRCVGVPSRRLTNSCESTSI